MGVLGGKHLAYGDTLKAIGRFIDRKQLTDVCILEFEQGLIVTGLAVYPAGESYNRNMETHVLSLDDLRRLMKEG